MPDAQDDEGFDIFTLDFIRPADDGGLSHGRMADQSAFDVGCADAVAGAAMAMETGWPSRSSLATAKVLNIASRVAQTMVNFKTNPRPCVGIATPSLGDWN